MNKPPREFDYERFTVRYKLEEDQLPELPKREDLRTKR
jgi:hypothetical protein